MTKLYRSRTDRKITGLCGGLAETLGFDATLLRLLVVITTFITGGVTIAIYFLAALVIPSEPWQGGPYAPPGAPNGPMGYSAPRWEHGCGSWRDMKKAEKYFRKAQRYGWNGYHGRPDYEANPAASGAGYQGQSNASGAGASDLDDMMKDIEKKAMWKEIEELRAKVAAYEKKINQQPKGEI